MPLAIEELDQPAIPALHNLLQFSANLPEQKRENDNSRFYYYKKVQICCLYVVLLMHVERIVWWSAG